MVNVFLAGSQSDERSALRLLISDMHMNVVGESADWPSTLEIAPKTCFDLLLVDWDLLPHDPQIEIAKLRSACPDIVSVVLFSHFNSREQAANSVGADLFISKGEMPERISEYIKSEAKTIRQKKSLKKFTTPSKKS
jgi:DNA-binding NarL/FixJ family response regulator